MEQLKNNKLKISAYHLDNGSPDNQALQVLIKSMYFIYVDV